MGFSMQRTIEIDMGHRVPTHGSKCWNLHGHRYVIEASVWAPELHASGVQTDMVLDFGFLKAFMMHQIHDFCDHGLTLWVEDPWLDKFLLRKMAVCKEMCASEGYFAMEENRDLAQTKMLVVPFVPTAERLAEFWFHRLEGAVNQHAPGKIFLKQVNVWETPNSLATFPDLPPIQPSVRHDHWRTPGVVPLNIGTETSPSNA